MPGRFTAFAALAALGSGPALAQDLIRPLGEGPFSWDGYRAFV